MPNAPTSEQIEKLHQQLAVLNGFLRKRTSFLYMFAYAIVQGIGYVIGATIFASIVIALLWRVIGTVDYVPLLNEFFTAEQLQESINEENFNN